MIASLSSSLNAVWRPLQQCFPGANSSSWLNSLCLLESNFVDEHSDLIFKSESYGQSYSWRIKPSSRSILQWILPSKQLTSNSCWSKSIRPCRLTSKCFDLQISRHWVFSTLRFLSGMLTFSEWMFYQTAWNLRNLLPSATSATSDPNDPSSPGEIRCGRIHETA